MKVLIVEPRKHPREAEIDGSLESMQKTVGGYLQAIYPFEDEIALVCDDESKLKSDTEWNRMLPETGDIIKGTFFIAGLGAEDFTDLSPEFMEKYKQRFWNIERGGCFFAVIIYTIQGRFSGCIFWQFSRLQLYTLCGNM